MQAWPRHERVLTRAERYELQQLLAQRGYDVGEPDGRLGGRTRDALRQFQAAIGQVPDGFASATVLWETSALSTSAVPMRWPLTLMTSSTRPVIQ